MNMHANKPHMQAPSILCTYIMYGKLVMLVINLSLKYGLHQKITSMKKY